MGVVGTIDHTRVRGLRVRGGLSIQDATRRAGFRARSNWTRIENGRRANPTVQTANAVALALGVKLDDILIKEGE